jgi:hypothetical protein
MYFCKKQRNIQSNPLMLKLIRSGRIKQELGIKKGRPFGLPFLYTENKKLSDK